MRAFVAWHYERHSSDRHIIDSYFDPAAFEAEMKELPGYFSPPRGALLVAEENGHIAGCVALRELRNGVCEMKRMFVAPEFHGRGVGQALARAVIKRARDLGYCKMMLDTGPAQREAQGLYRKIGFKMRYDQPHRISLFFLFNPGSGPCIAPAETRPSKLPLFRGE